LNAGKIPDSFGPSSLRGSRSHWTISGPVFLPASRDTS